MSDNQPNNDPAATPEFPVAPPAVPAPDFAAPAAPAAPPAFPAAPPAAPEQGLPAVPAPAYPAAPAPGYPAPNAGQPAAGMPYAGVAPAPGLGPVKPKGLAITGMILGIAGLVFCWVPFLGALLAVVGILLCIIAMIKKQPLGFTLTGLITGALGLIISIFILVAFFAAIAMIGSSSGDLLEIGNEMIAQCQDGATEVEVMGQMIPCSQILG